MAQDFRIMAPDQVRAVTVTNVSQSVALDVNVVSAMFSATINLDPVITVTSSQTDPVWITGSIANLSASVTFPVAVSQTFNLSSSQVQDLTITEGMQGAAIQWSMGVGSGTVYLSVDALNYTREVQFDLASSSFKDAATHNGVFVVPTIAGAKSIRMRYDGVGTASGTMLVTYAPFTGHVSGSDQQQYISGAALVTGTVRVTGTVAVEGLVDTTVAYATSSNNLQWVNDVLVPLSVDLSGNLRVTGTITSRPVGTGSIVGTNATGSATTDLALNVLPAVGLTSPTAGTAVAGRMTYLRTDVSGNLWTTVIKPATVSFSSASLTSSTTTLLASNPVRIGATVSNRSLSFPVYVALGPSASFDRYGVRLPPNGYFEVPYGFTGVISAACSGSQTAVVMVEEVTK